VVSFGLVAYLGFDGGGYDTITRGEVGIVICWLVILGSVLGLLPVRRLGRGGWSLLGLLALFAAWTALSLTWTDSVELTHLELSRVAMLVGVLALGIGIGRDSIGSVVGGVGSAIAAIAAAAALSRLHPAWFPANQTADFLGQGSQSRLNYPVNYWNALAELIALGIPIMLAAASRARQAVVRGAAAAVLPVMGLAVYMTYSRASAVAVAVAVIVYLALAEERIANLGIAFAAAAATAGLIAAFEARSALADGLTTAGARQQGDELLALVAIAALGSGLAALAVGRAAGGRRVPARRARRLVAIAGAVVLAAAIAAGATGAYGRVWNDFKRSSLDVPRAQTNLGPRFGSASGNGRYQFWQAAIDESATAPLHGTGAGTFQLWWQRHGSPQSDLRHAHSFFFETLGELGWVGLAIGVGLFGSLLTIAIRRTLRSPPLMRAWAAAGAAACVAFIVGASVDWVWQLAVLPVAALLIGAAIAVGHDPRPLVGRARTATRAIFAGLGLAALVAIVPPVASTAALRSSQREAAAGRLTAALRDAERAASVEPDDASPRLQQALVLELDHRLAAAVAAAREAVAREPANWQNWLVLARIEAEDAMPTASVQAFSKARQLNPRPPIFLPGGQ
jgi:hypothetical protein